MMGSKKATMGTRFSALFRPTTILFPPDVATQSREEVHSGNDEEEEVRKLILFGLIRRTPIMVFVQYPRSLEASLRSLQRQRPVHEILGGGIVADVILWRRKDVTLGILLGALSSWVLFEVAGYTVVSLLSNVLLLLFSILFVWTKAARIVNRPPPSIPEMHLTEEMVHEAAAFVGLYVNAILSTFNDIVKKRDTKVFFRIALYLWLISLISGFVDLHTLAYSSLVIILTVPALYEKYEDCIDRYFKLLHMEVQMYERVYTQCFSKYFVRTNKWVLDMKKLLVDA